MIRSRAVRRLTMCLALAGALPLRTAAADPAPVMPLAGHHATYKLSLLKATGTNAPQAVDGLLSYDFSGSACDGYAMTLRQVTALQPQEGDARVSDMKTASFEGGDAHDYRFKVDTGADGAAAAAATVDGSAHRVADGAVQVDLQQPETAKVDLPVGVLFPTEHMKKIIATALGGGKLLSAEVYDGSETGRKVFNTLTVIGAQTTSVPPEAAAQADALKAVPRWPVTISYFDTAKTDGPPDYVLTFDLYENGISRALRLDYGDFVLSGEMTDLKLMPAAKTCP